MIKRFKVTISEPKAHEFPVEYRTKFIGAVFSLLKFGKYHDAPEKPYSVSDIQGMFARDGYLIKSDKADSIHFFITSSNPMFIRDFNSNFSKLKDNFNLFGTRITGMSSEDVFLNDYYDIVRTISPLLIRDIKGVYKKDWWFTHRDTEKWLALVNDNAIRKIQHAGLPTEGFKIELVKKIGHSKNIFIHENFNPSCLAVLKVTGDYMQRELLFSEGLGTCTGIGFGALSLQKLFNKNEEFDFD